MSVPTEEVLCDDRAGVRLITLNRPDAANAINTAMESRYYGLLADAERDPAVRVVVVTGTGRAFCTGIDLSCSVEDLVAGGAPLPERHRDRYPPTMRTPVIAAINGACAGLGLALALQADIRFVAETAKLTTAFVQRGLIAEHGVAWTLPRIVGRGRAMDLLLSGRVITGAQAAEYGLAEFVTSREDLLPRALEYAQDIAAKSSPRAAAVIKAQVARSELVEAFNELLDADDRTRVSFGWPDLVEGIRSWQEKRPVSFPQH